MRAGQKGSAVKSGAARFLMEKGMTKPRVMQCLGDMINNSGAENYTDAKRVELALNDMLTNGWTGITGRAYDANADYLAAKDAIDGGIKADSWERFLAQNELSLIDGTVTEEEYMEKLSAFVARNTDKVKNGNVSDILQAMYLRDSRYYKTRSGASGGTGRGSRSKKKE